MFNFTEMKVDGLKMKIDLGVVRDNTTNNTAYWQINAASLIDFKDLRVSTDSVVFNTALEIFHQVLLIYLKAEENGYGSAFKKAIDQFNIILRTRSSVMIPSIFGSHHLWNATVSYPPELDIDSQIAEVSIDGTIYDTYLKTSHVETTTTKANRLSSYPGNQIFIHESALASYFYSVYDKIMPLKIDDISTSLEIIAEFPEIKSHYGGKGT